CARGIQWVPLPPDYW
nr:immunoglobulin heavy chain junction region [Macaca mulatta]